MNIRTALSQDASALARLINDAFVVEAFFKIGDRTSADEITGLMGAGGEFLIIDNVEPGTIVGCVYLKCSAGRAYFGMLSIEPANQGRGLGRRLIDALETRAREQGCRVIDLHIVNLREELLSYYRSLGYEEAGTLPFSEPERASRPCYFIVMSKSL